MSKKGHNVILPEMKVGDQLATLGKHSWSVSRLIELSKDIPVFEIPIDGLNIYCKYKNLTLREMAMHVKMVNEADLSFPIILDEDGDLLDGRHRIIRALLDGEEKIKAVRFFTNPNPCKIKNDDE